MSIPRDIRNKLALRKVVRVSQQTTFSTITSKFWNVHTPSLKPLDLDAVQVAITKSLLCGSINIVELIDSIHARTEHSIFEHEKPTKAFMKAIMEDVVHAN
ncbi:hypothetical protein [Vibrio sp. THAF190c]|jgi:hypothetical protein|uniref:hypothetical protein n=1 Tax=Vibrio sp. THAF190c TaxID=2587865 RepID=UPI001267BE33|nr:hypothetical protein [Vibrio sp. THAF190c]QFT13430.1 hypothetical protein FIV04_26105 [Vibrio sp. THAF190c]